MSNDHATEKSATKRFEIEVNGRTVILTAKEVTGLQIKEAAMAQSVNIQTNFVLQQELPNGSSAIIGDADVVHVHPHVPDLHHRHGHRGPEACSRRVYVCCGPQASVSEADRYRARIVRRCGRRLGSCRPVRRVGTAPRRV